MAIFQDNMRARLRLLTPMALVFVGPGRAARVGGGVAVPGPGLGAGVLFDLGHPPVMRIPGCARANMGVFFVCTPLGAVLGLGLEGGTPPVENGTRPGGIPIWINCGEHGCFACARA